MRHSARVALGIPVVILVALATACSGRATSAAVQDAPAPVAPPSGPGPAPVAGAAAAPDVSSTSPTPVTPAPDTPAPDTADPVAPAEPPSSPAAPPADALVGWAAVAGDGVPTTTGGEGGREVRVSSADALQQAALEAQPLTILIEGTIEIPRLSVSSNKTLRGVDDTATLRGGIRIRGKQDAPVTNVILSNLRVDGSSSDVDGDAIQIHYAHHVWVDHCEVWDAPDGNLDVVHASSWVTVSYTRFRYTDGAPDPDHRFSNLIGHSDDNADEDQGRLKVTLHHNHWAAGVVERMPRVRFGEVHVFNNYYTSSDANYAVAAGLQSRLLLENNVFEGVRDPHRFYDGEPTAQIVSRGNLYERVQGARDSGQGAAFEPPYPYQLDDAAEVRELVTRRAGPLR